MAARNKPYEQFGPYILFKKLETDSLGDLWRAGRISGSEIGSTVALRRLLGGHREALTANVQAAAQILPQLTGPSFVREQHAGLVGNVPFVAWDYQGGRSLRHIIDCARGGNGTPPNPLPIDQAVVIAEKVALSLATIAELRDGGNRLSHGALIPQWIWISDDGEIRVAGQQLGTGLTASAADAKISAEIGRYLSPEQRTSGLPPKNADVYSMGAILFLLVTGQEPPDAATASAFVAAVRAAKTMTGSPVPDDIRVVLDKSFNLDPSMRYQSIADMKQAIAALAHGGKYSATTFNLAFYLSTLLKKEMESESVDREKEAKVNVAAYLETPRAAEPAAPTPVPAMFTAAAEAKPKSKMPLAVAAVVVLALVGGGAFMMMRKTQAQPPAMQVTTAQTLPASTPPPAPRIISEHVVASASPQSAVTATTGPADPAVQKKAFEQAVEQKLQAEMMKLQEQYEAELRKQQSKNAPAPVAPQVAAAAPAPAPVQNDDRPSITAAQLDQQRRDTTRPEPQVTEAQTQTIAPPPVQTQTTAPAAPAPQQVVATVREGDVVGVAALDRIPKPTRPIAPVYPAIARQQRIAATIILSAFINEDGQVTDVKVLRGDARFGLNDAAMRAMRATRFTSPMKDGKRVKTWFPQTIEFKP